MEHDRFASNNRKPVNLTLDSGIVAAAREAGLNLSKVSEAALREATSAEQRRRWLDENREALAGWNRWYEKNGDPLAAYKLW